MTLAQAFDRRRTAVAPILFGDAQKRLPRAHGESALLSIVFERPPDSGVLVTVPHVLHAQYKKPPSSSIAEGASVTATTLVAAPPASGSLLIWLVVE